jgi:hypothetical protein
MFNKRGEWWEGLATRSMEESYCGHKRKILKNLKVRGQRCQHQAICQPRAAEPSIVTRAIEKLKKKKILPNDFVIKQELGFRCPVDVVVTKNTFLPPEGHDGAQCSGCYPIVYWALPIPIVCCRLSTPSQGVSIHNDDEWKRNCFQYKIAPSLDMEEEATNSPAGPGGGPGGAHRCQIGGNMLSWMAKDTSIGGCWATGGHVRF